MKYLFNGNVYNFNTLTLNNVEFNTIANSKEKAKSNIIYKAKMRLNLDKNSKIKLIGKLKEFINDNTIKIYSINDNNIEYIKSEQVKQVEQKQDKHWYFVPYEDKSKREIIHQNLKIHEENNCRYVTYNDENYYDYEDIDVFLKNGLNGEDIIEFK